MHAAPALSSLAFGTVVLTAATALQAAPDYSAPGPYPAGWTTVQVRRADNTTFDALLFYPATVPGNGAPYNNAGAPYPAISFGHGFATAATRYQSTLAHLATWGYFVMATRSWEGIFPFPDHAKYAADISRCLTYLEQQNSNSGSFLYQQLDAEHYGLTGHSMGGGASILAAAADPRIGALAPLAPAETDPSAIAAMANVQIAVRIITGDEDSITPFDQHARPIYENGDAPRQLPLIFGGYHCGFLDSPIAFCDDGSLSLEAQLALTRRLLTEFFNLYLKDDQPAWRGVWGPEYIADTSFDTTRFDPGVEFTPRDVELAGSGGSVVETQLTLTNTGPQPDSFTLFVEDQAWPTTLLPVQTAELNPNESTLIAVRIEIPADGAESDAALLSARSARDGGTRGFARVTTARWTVGDLNCDGSVDFGDITPFVLALSDPAGYAQQFPDCDRQRADINGDGAVDFGDINPFVALLSGT